MAKAPSNGFCLRIVCRASTTARVRLCASLCSWFARQATSLLTVFTTPLGVIIVICFKTPMRKSNLLRGLRASLLTVASKEAASDEALSALARSAAETATVEETADPKAFALQLAATSECLDDAVFQGKLDDNVDAIVEPPGQQVAAPQGPCFGYETTDHISEASLRSYVMCKERGALAVFEHIFFDPQVPNNHTIRFKSDYPARIDVLVDGAWQSRPRQEVLAAVLVLLWKVMVTHVQTSPGLLRRVCNPAHRYRGPYLWLSSLASDDPKLSYVYTGLRQMITVYLYNIKMRGARHYGSALAELRRVGQVADVVEPNDEDSDDEDVGAFEGNTSFVSKHFGSSVVEYMKAIR
jgi:hypothetical protein